MASLSVVIPVYNRARQLPDTLDSILSQNRLPDELILVDNNSSDDSRDVCENYKRTFLGRGCRTVVLTEMTPGAAAARNTGLKHSSCDWVMFFDSDDLMRANHISSVMETVAGNPEADIVGWDIIYQDSAGVKSIKPFPKGDHLWQNIMHGSLSTQRYMASRNLFIKAGGWDSAIRYWDDIELGARLLKLKPRITKREGEVSVIVRASANSITGDGYLHALDNAVVTLKKMAETMNGHTGYTAIKAAILAGDIYREEPLAGRNLIRMLKRGEIVGPVTSKISLLSTLVYNYRRIGLRGAGRLVRPLIK